MMRHVELSISLFGPSIFRLSDRPVRLALKGATRELLLYLVAHAGQEVRREWVADLLWCESSECRQRSALNSALWRIGKKLPSHPGLVLRATDTTLCLTIDPTIPVDTRTLCRAVRDACTAHPLDAETARRLTLALDSSEAPFMDGLDADWTLAERERISNIRIRGMIALMHHHGDNRDYEEALQLGRRLLAEDPFRESVQIDVMWLYVLNGQRTRAIRQYETFADMLREELAIEPMVETRALYEHIRGGMDDLSRSGIAFHDSVRPGVGRRGLDSVLAAVEQSRRDLYQTLRSPLG